MNKTTKKTGFLSLRVLVILSSFALVSVFSGCQTLQEDRYVSLIENESLSEVQKVECDLFRLEADDAVSSLSQNDLLIRTDKISAEIERLLSKSSLELFFRAKLLSLKGRIFLLTGKKAPARECYEKAVSYYSGEVNSVILAHRLGIIKGEVESLKISGGGKEFLFIEKAMNFYKAGKYRDAVSAFDSAFLNLDENYKNCYKNIRDSAWTLRDSKKSSSTNLLKEKSTVMEVLSAIQNESSILYPYTASKKVSDEELYRKVSKSALLTASSIHNGEDDSSGNSKSKDSSKKGKASKKSGKASSEEAVIPSKDDVCTRRIASRLLWNVLNEKRFTSQGKLKYTSLFKDEKTSPVSDISYYDEDFDAILGCVEEELLDLPDGENFFPENPVSLKEVLKAAKQL